MKAPLESTGHQGVTEISLPQDLAGSRSVPAADAAALSLVFLLFFCVVCFVWGAAVLGRREKRVADEDPALSEEREARQASSTDRPPPKPNAAVWERDADWWKKRR